MINSSLQQMVLYDDYLCRKDEVISLLLARKDILQVAQKAINIGFQRFSEKMKDDPYFFLEKATKPTTLNAEIKKVFSELSKDLPGVQKMYKDGSSYFVVDRQYFLFIKKLNKSGLPSYLETRSALEKLSTQPCAFIGPRIDDSYMNFGGAYVSVTSSKDSVMWFDAIDNLLPQAETIAINRKSGNTIDSILKVKEEKLEERNIQELSQTGTE